MQASVTRVLANGPNDTSGLAAAADRGDIIPANIIAILGKTEGNGCVNDFTRGYATDALKGFISARTGQTTSDIEEKVVFVMSGGTEGGLSPHWTIFEVSHDAKPSKPGAKALAIGTAITRPFGPHEIGRMAQVEETASAVRAAMFRAGIERVDDVHYVQVKCPLLTKSRIAAAAKDGRSVITNSTLESMGYSRGASALGVAIALDEIPEAAICDDVICRDYSLYSARASTSAGVELLENQILVVGNSLHWSGELVASHDVMSDAIDSSALIRALSSAGVTAGYPLASADRVRVHAVLAKAEAARSGMIREARHTMLDDSDIASSRHARALVGGVLAGVLGCTDVFVSGGAEHQGPDGGGPVAIIVNQGSSERVRRS